MDIKSILKDEYCLDNIYIEQINYGLVDENYKIISSNGTFFFKIYNSISSFDFKKLHDDLRLLKKSNIPVPLETNRKNKTTSNHFYALYDFTEGKKYDSSINQMKSISQIFRKVIQVGISNHEKLSTKPLLFELEDSIHKLLLLSKKTKLPKEVKSICSEYYYLSKKVKEKIISYIPDKLDCIPLHPDFTERNFLFSNDSVVLLCDWQGYSHRILLDELFCAFARFCTSNPFEGYLEEKRMIEFKLELTRGNKLISTSLYEYAHLFPWLLVRKQICNTPFRINGIFGTIENRELMIKILLWSRDFINWLINNEDMLYKFLRK
ncbi:MAG: phosphotransferase [Clostridiales bacterium]